VLSEVRGVSLLAESLWHLVFSWGNRFFLGVIVQGEFMELRLLSRGKAERIKVSLVSLFHCFVIAGRSKKQTQNLLLFCAYLQVPESKFVSRVSRKALLVGFCFPFPPTWEYFCLQIQGDAVKIVQVSKVNLVYMKGFLSPISW